MQPTNLSVEPVNTIRERSKRWLRENRENPSVQKLDRMGVYRDLCPNGPFPFGEGKVDFLLVRRNGKYNFFHLEYQS